MRKKKRSKHQKQEFKTWYREKRPFLQFVGLFGLLMALFYLSTLSSLFKDYFFPWYLNFNARISGLIIGIFHGGVNVSGANVVSPAFAINIERGCDATGPIALFVSAVLAFSAPFNRKILGVIIGALMLIIINFARIVSLFFVGIHFPNAFHVMHVDVWQAIFIFLSILFWSIWAVKATGKIN